MTWQQFKDYVDAKLAELGRDGTIPVCYIDVSHPSLNYEMRTPHLSVGTPDDPELAIS